MLTVSREIIVLTSRQQEHFLTKKISPYFLKIQINFLDTENVFLLIRNMLIFMEEL